MSMEARIEALASAVGADIRSLQVQISQLERPVMGGSLADYHVWALAAHPAVTRAWVTEHEQGVGSVVVRPVCDNEATPIPAQDVLDAVAAYIDVRRQVGLSALYVLPPVAAAVQYQIRLTPDSGTVRTAVEAELRELHRQQAAPGAPLSINHIQTAIGTAAGGTGHELLAPLADLVHGTGVMPTFGGITWL